MQEMAFAFAPRRQKHGTRALVAEATTHGPFDAAVVKTGRPARDGCLLQTSWLRRRSWTTALLCPARRGHGHVPLATAAVSAVRMRMTGGQARTNEIAKEVHGPSPQSSAAAPRGRAGDA